MPKKFLIIQTAFIGDVVLATAVPEKLHQFYPGAAIDFLVRKGNEGLLKGHPFLREVLVWDKKKGKIKNLFRMLTEIRKRKYDVVVNVQRFAATGLLTSFSGAGKTIGFDKNPFSFLFTEKYPHLISTREKPFHETERNQILIETLTDRFPAKPRLYPSATDYEKVKPFTTSPYVCIAPASVWHTKQYPAEKWISFINKVPDVYNVFLIGAPTDYKLADGIIRALVNKDRVKNMCGQFSLLESAALQHHAVMNYVNDSAPMHFASAMNAPVSAVYCSTVPSFGFGPLSAIRHIIEVQEDLSCRPCGLHGKTACPLGHFNCAHHIKDEQLLATLPS